MTKLKLKVDMHCATCSRNIDSLLKKNGLESQSNPALKITKLNYDESKISEQEIIKLIKGIGYDAKKR